MGYSGRNTLEFELTERTVYNCGFAELVRVAIGRPYVNSCAISLVDNDHVTILNIFVITETDGAPSLITVNPRDCSYEQVMSISDGSLETVRRWQEKMDKATAGNSASR